MRIRHVGLTPSRTCQHQKTTTSHKVTPSRFGDPKSTTVLANVDPIFINPSSFIGGVPLQKWSESPLIPVGHPPLHKLGLINLLVLTRECGNEPRDSRIKDTTSKWLWPQKVVPKWHLCKWNQRLFYPRNPNSFVLFLSHTQVNLGTLHLEPPCDFCSHSTVV